MRILIRLLSCVVIVSSAITVWTRAALVFALGPQLTSACLWIAAGGSLCAVITLACTRKRNRRPFESFERASSTDRSSFCRCANSASA